MAVSETSSTCRKSASDTIFQAILPLKMKPDRYDAISSIIDFFAPARTPLSQRALPAGSEMRPLIKLEILKPLPMQQSNVMPWFGQEGMGVQFQTTIGSTGKTVRELIELKYLKEIR